MHSYLGLVGYFSHYVRNFSIINTLLTKELKGKPKKEAIQYASKHEVAFCALKEKTPTKANFLCPQLQTRVFHSDCQLKLEDRDCALIDDQNG